jgi:RNA polymerase sigma factor (TIGR02999 family)
MVHDGLPHDRAGEEPAPTDFCAEYPDSACPVGEVTRILVQAAQGSAQATDDLLPLVYDELRRLAARKLARERPGQTLQTTALVHEAYLRLVGNEQSGQAWDNRGHFFAAAAEAMRRILVEQARKHRRREAIRGVQVSLDDLPLVMPAPNEELLQLDEALRKLESADTVSASLVKLRFFAGLTMAQAAQAVGLPMRTAERTWTYARAWLHRELEHPVT